MRQIIYPTHQSRLSKEKRQETQLTKEEFTLSKLILEMLHKLIHKYLHIFVILYDIKLQKCPYI